MIDHEQRNAEPATDNNTPEQNASIFVPCYEPDDIIVFTSRVNDTQEPITIRINDLDVAN